MIKVQCLLRTKYKSAKNVLQGKYGTSDSKAQCSLKELVGLNPFLIAASIYLPIVHSGRALGYIVEDNVSHGLQSDLSASKNFSSLTPGGVNAEKLVIFDEAKLLELRGNSGLRLLPQAAGIISKMPVGLAVDGQPFRAYGRSGGSTITNKITVGQLLKAILLGYLKLPSDFGEDSSWLDNSYRIKQCTNACTFSIHHSVQPPVDPEYFKKFKAITTYGATNNGPDVQIRIFEDCCIGRLKLVPSSDGSKTFTDKSITVEEFMTKYQEATEAWPQSQYLYDHGVSEYVSKKIVRSPEPVKSIHEVHWRKPSKNSIWPYTLDHHFCEVTENSITSMNLTLKALLSSDENGRGYRGRNSQKVETINQNYPMFEKDSNLTQARYALEEFFGMMNPADGDSFLARGATLDQYKWKKWTAYLQALSRTDYPTLNKQYAATRLCMSLGVVPSFNNKTGNFEKFLPLEKLHTPTKKVYFDTSVISIVEDSRKSSRDYASSEINGAIALTMLFCYEVGIISLETLETVTNFAQLSATFENQVDLLQVNIGNHLVACLPITEAMDRCKDLVEDKRRSAVQLAAATTTDEE